MGRFAEIFRRVGAVALAAALFCLAGCAGEQQASPQDLQDMKREAVKQNAGKLTPQAEYRILGIRATSRKDFERQVRQIMEEEGAKNPQVAPAAPRM